MCDGMTALDLAMMLKRRRAALSLTQEQAAERAGVGVATWKRWEAGGGACGLAASFLRALDRVGVEVRIRSWLRDQM